MTDLSKCTLAELEAEIERRKAEPDYAAWEPKWQAFREVMDCTLPFTKNHYIRALIAALLLAFCAMTADNIIAGIVAVSYGTASHQGE